MDIYELQSVSGWTIDDIKKVLPFISVKNNSEPHFISNIGFGEIKNNLLFRINEMYPLSIGYKIDSALGKRLYAGSASGFSMKYDVGFSNKLKFGLAIDKDPGETFLKRNTTCFDFVSSYVSYNRSGILKTLFVGDYSVNLGQGLILWQSPGINKSPEVMMIKRQSAVIKPYHSLGENEFFRGVALTLSAKKITDNIFFSYRKIDANISSDSLGNYVTS